ncbi:MAG: NUDIX hydrolase [Nanoarchaeota archaeon]
MEIEQEIQRSILKKLMHEPDQGFNRLWAKESESNRFAYHLKTLVDQGLVEKHGDAYRLSAKGVSYVTYLDGATGKRKEKPVVCSFVIGYDAGEEKVLVNIRRKEPFYDYLGIPGGKIEMGTSPMQTAREEFLEETGLTGPLKLVAMSNYTTEDITSRKLLHHVISYTYLCSDSRGSLKKRTREGENRWIFVDEIDKHRCYPEIPHFIKTVLLNRDRISFFNIHRYQKDGEFLKEFDIVEEF